jgi:hypothetical protein
MIDFYTMKRKFQKNFVKKGSRPCFPNTLQDYHYSSPMMVCGILIQNIIHFKRKKKLIRGGFNYGTKIKIEGYRDGFNGDSVLRKTGKEKKGIYIKKKEKRKIC